MSNLSGDSGMTQGAGERQDRDIPGAALAERVGTTPGGGAGGQDVIHQQDRKTNRFSGAESIDKVGFPVFLAQGGLGFVPGIPADQQGTAGQMQTGCRGFRQGPTVIDAAFPADIPVLSDC